MNSPGTPLMDGHPKDTEPRILTDALRLRAAKNPNDTAHAFLPDGETIKEVLTYRELDESARALAGSFTVAGLAGRHALLVYPSGLDFIRCLFGCMYAGVAAAPVQVPRNRHGLDRLRRIGQDARTSTVFTTAEIKHDLEQRFGDLRRESPGLALIATDTLDAPDGGHWPAASFWRAQPGGTALLQYTSGSTGDPKGVVVTHANFLGNVAETEALWPKEPRATVVSWLPLFHDMGMLFGVMLPIWAGVPCYLMPPEAFIRRPARWLEAVSRFGGTHSAAPDFAYELCARAAAEGRASGVGDLSEWRVAANGAEPVRWRTIRSFTEAFAPHGFRPEAMTPGYGLAENTLKATGKPPGSPPKVLWLSARSLGEGRAEAVDTAARGATPIVSTGVPVLGTTVRIVDPDSRTECPPGRVGEIWIGGPCVAAGYLDRPELSEKTFRARIRGEASARPHLRTGDLGFLHEGELYVTGRRKDVIIRSGRNHYPQDIELSVESAISGLHPNCAAAFSVDDGSEERLVIVVEADGRVLKAHSERGLRDRVHDVVYENHRLRVHDVLVVRRGALPKTTSGKIQRQACRIRYQTGELASFVPAHRTPPAGATIVRAE